MSDRTTASHLGFYKAHGISPVRQDISDLERHFQRRSALHRHLGVLPSAVRGRSVLEVGPGSGHNAVHTAYLGPARYVLVEGNPTGIAHMRALFAEHVPATDVIEIVESRIEDYRTDAPFDVVFCEGLLSGVPNPEEVLASLAAATAPGGILVTTCVDHLSHFPETVRRLLAQLAISPDDPLDVQVEKILPMMAPHLATLSHASRRADDWVIDNLIHPGSIIPLINFPETIAVLDGEFQFLASSPHFVADWRWYKSIVGDDFDFNGPALEQYWINAHNLMDHRHLSPPRAGEANQRLYDLCTKARAQVAAFEARRDDVFVARFRALLQEIVADLQSCAPAAAAALAEADDLLAAEIPDPQAVAGASRFAALFGRGQQYMSFTKNDRPQQ
jgi:SAM-dependent methyltransferase